MQKVMIFVDQANFYHAARSRGQRADLIKLKEYLADPDKGRILIEMVVYFGFPPVIEEPHDIDTVIFLPMDFYQQIEREYEPALELEEMLLTRRPEEIFAAEDEADWNEWVAFFSRTREPDGRHKGLVEIRL